MFTSDGFSRQFIEEWQDKNYWKVMLMIKSISAGGFGDVRVPRIITAVMECPTETIWRDLPAYVQKKIEPEPQAEIPRTRAKGAGAA